MVKANGAVHPVDDEGREFLAKMRDGQGVRLEIKRVRNYRFLCKTMTLFKLAFDVWEPDPDGRHAVLGIQKEFERFRKDITILAGFFEESWGLDGRVRIEAKSLAYENMTEDEFGRVYSAVLTVIWDKVLRDLGRYRSPDEVESVVNELLRY